MKKQIIENLKTENYECDGTLQINSLLEFFINKKKDGNFDELQLEKYNVSRTFQKVWSIIKLMIL